MRLVALTTLMLFAVACRDPQLQNTSGDVTFSTGSLDLGKTWKGLERVKSVRVQNRGRSPLEVQWTVPDGFEVAPLPDILPAGETAISVRFRSEVPVKREGVLTVTWNGTNTAELALSAEALETPICTPVACHSVHFDAALGKCVDEALADGTECDPHSVCVTNASCQAGRCVGTPVTCNDGNACTVDICDPITGCEFPPAPPCPGDGKCQTGVCNPATGCTTVTAPDGTACGSVTCDAAEVCISGACVVRDPADGYVCAEASPCQSEGICQGSSCVRGSVTPIEPSWSFDSSMTGVDGGTPLFLHDFVMESSGEMSLFGFFSQPVLRANGAAPVTTPEAARRCIDWNGRLACADFGPRSTNGTVALLDFQTGTPSWVFSIAAARPDIAAENLQVFMARLVSMGTDRLAAIFESYPNANDGCRAYYVVALDAGGSMQWVQKIEDPIFDRCDHPHPYGAATDLQGNLYLSFSPSVGATGSIAGAPLAAQLPTLYLSFTRDGVLRWKQTTQDRGGELAVANGLIFPEHTQVPLDASTGLPISIANLDPNRAHLGRVVASSDKYVNGALWPQYVNDSELHAYGLNGDPAWTYRLPVDFTGFISSEPRAIDWKPNAARPTTRALLQFTQAMDNLSLYAVAVKEQDGSELWMCPVDVPPGTRPDLVEVVNGRIGMMSGSSSCGDCDPPFANSSSTFTTFDLPGISEATVPWPGTFGGASHDHAEKAFVPSESSTPAN